MLTAQPRLLHNENLYSYYAIKLIYMYIFLTWSFSTTTIQTFKYAVGSRDELKSLLYITQCENINPPFHFNIPHLYCHVLPLISLL